MRTIFFAAAIALGGAAFAQTTDPNAADPPAGTETATDEQTTTDAQTTTTDVQATTTTTGVTTSATGQAMSTTTMTTGSGMVAPGNAAPERDARGIPVVSDPAMVPPGVNAAPGMAGAVANPAAAFATQPSTDTYPACSRTVTDNCVQAYERGRKPSK